MERFCSILPTPLLASYVKEYWFLSTDSTFEGRQRAIPTGYMGIILNRGGDIYSQKEGLFPRAYLFGQSVKPVDMYFNNLNLIIVILQPLACKALFNLAGHELKGQSIELGLLSQQFKELESRLFQVHDEKSIACLVDTILLSHIHKQTDYNYKRFIPVLQSIDMGESNISTLADEACLGYKQFKRLFVEYIGLNPKEFIQIKRLSKTLHLLQTMPFTSLSDIANKCGYYDKSHLIREVKSFSGYTPNDFLLNADSYSDNRSLFQSFFVDIKT